MKILHVSAEALRGGCEKNCYHFIKGSAAIDHEVVVLGKPGPMSEDWADLNVRLIHLDILSANLISFGNRLRSFFKRQNQYDLIICWSTIRLPLQLNAIRDKATAVRVHLGNPVGPSYRSLKDELLSILYPVPSRKIALVACSQYVANSHRKSDYFSRFTIRVSLNPVSLLTKYPLRKTNKELFQMGMVARLDPIKDHRTVIEAFKILHAQIPEARLHLVGDGSMRGELQSLVSELGIEQGVIFHGEVKDVYALLNQWDLFIYSTTPQEGLGSVVEEAMANALPCVLSDLPMLRELAPEDNLVLWFKPQDSSALASQVLRLYQDPEMRNHLSEAVYDYATTHFSVNRFIEDYIH